MQPDRNRRYNRGEVALLTGMGVLALVALLVVATQAGSSRNTGATTASNRAVSSDERADEREQRSNDELRTEDKLALMFGGDPNRIGVQLDAAAEHCPEGRDRIADYITVTMQELDKGKPSHGENALSIATAIAEVAEVDSGAKCSEVAAALLVLMLDCVNGGSGRPASMGPGPP